MAEFQNALIMGATEKFQITRPLLGFSLDLLELSIIVHWPMPSMEWRAYSAFEYLNKRPLGLTAPLSNCLCYTNDV